MPRVMIVDDAIYMRTVIKDIFTKAGFEVVGEAENGSEALEKYSELKPDLVTMDMVMLGMSGIESVKEIIKRDPKARILMVSAMGQQALVVESIQAGTKGFVIKPFTPEALIDEAKRILGESEGVHATT